MLADFNSEWNRRPTKSDGPEGLTTVEMGSQPTFTFDSDPLILSDFESLNNRTKTIYVFARVSWRDQTGEWATDYCEGFQDKFYTSGVLHSCVYIDASRVRYRAKR